jgi:D-glycero-D-manno-heptose 1,7-bisphosphate phosphatase
MAMNRNSDAKKTQLPARRPAAFLDRDGVLNFDDGYVFRPEALRLVPGAAAAVRRLNAAGYLTVVVTNQSGVARGYFTEADMDAFHAHLVAALARDGARLDAIYSCPYHPEGIVERYRADHPDRKPGPGMILRAIADLDIDTDRSFLIGDRSSDIEAARRAGIPGHLFGTDDLAVFVDRILG